MYGSIRDDFSSLHNYTFNSPLAQSFRRIVKSSIGLSSKVPKLLVCGQLIQPPLKNVQELPTTADKFVQ